ncbi:MULTISPECIES: NAD-dependent epimerase/dehydratase family protein [unclassified Sphingobium]|uniref:NAD-dependent epimerase/dehydratase family protein n=1 Tax=unclassified Sphingobium TaxID=2611147 RepID=UPI0022246EB8|nr:MULTISPECIES: NAD(P)-dependent oxidoreductase [unclassified Sphingobium]MCW2396657.1 nucleoside-diphosphate-sugar epimerase [Sphingobium sp. B8D3B]MCW2420174.1 nucleoside-diphosphate-sugar epimerase [Sphingobium sp. B8D3C]
MKILVTGSSGFVGRQVINQLIGRDVAVVGSSRTAVELIGAEHVATDLTMPGAAAALIEQVRPSHLLHLAWNAVPGKFWNAADNLDWCAASVELVRAFHAAGGKRAVLAGSCAEYDWTCDGRLDEHISPINPATLYGVSKDALRRMVLRDAEQHGHSVAWGRIFWLYGPNEGPGRLVSDVATALCCGRVPEVSEGRQRRDFLHVADVASAFVAALNSDYQGVFNICSGSAVEVRDVVRCVAEALNRPENIRFGARPTNLNEPPLLYGSVDRLHGDIGFRPFFNLHDGLANTAQWWIQNSTAV